jgi:hypothetical protein
MSKWRVVLETKIELDEDNIVWTKDGEKEFSYAMETQWMPRADLKTEWESRYLTECLLVANSAAAGGDLEGTLAFGTARSNPLLSNSIVDTADNDEYADVYFHQVFGRIGYKVIEELHFLQDRAESPVEQEPSEAESDRA